MPKNPLVSTLMISYNHEAFISQAIKGVLMQKTNFPIELIIGEDYSIDGTREICFEYQQKYPEIIRVLPREENLGMMPNFVDAFKSCRGKYIALCEGDDYWTDLNKLQKQIDFLEANSDFVICFHNMQVVYEDGNLQPHISNVNQQQITTFEDLAAKNFIQTASCCFRNNLFGDFPKWFVNMSVGDWVLHLLNAQYGKIMYLDEVMGVYRVHEQGAWSMKTIEETSRRWKEVVETCYKHFYPRAKNQFARQISRAKIDLCFCCFEKEDYVEFRRTYWDYIFNTRPLLFNALPALTLRYIVKFCTPVHSRLSKVSKTVKVVIGDFCEISPYSNLLGNVVLGRLCSIGTGSIILPKVKIGDNVTVAAGAVFTKNVMDNTTVMGVPAKPLLK